MSKREAWGDYARKILEQRPREHKLSHKAKTRIEDAIKQVVINAEEEKTFQQYLDIVQENKSAIWRAAMNLSDARAYEGEKKPGDMKAALLMLIEGSFGAQGRDRLISTHKQAREAVEAIDLAIIEAVKNERQNILKERKTDRAR